MRQIIRTNGMVNGIFYILLLNMNAKFTKKLGMAPGGEFRCAVKEAQQIPNCVIQLGDREIKVTLHLYLGDRLYIEFPRKSNLVISHQNIIYFRILLEVKGGFSHIVNYSI